MNRSIFKNFFTMLLAGLLIIAMAVLQRPEEDGHGLVYWLGLIIICCCVVFILYNTVKISQSLYEKDKELASLKNRLQNLVKDDRQTRNDEQDKKTVQ